MQPSNHQVSLVEIQQHEEQSSRKNIGATFPEEIQGHMQKLL